MKTLKFIYIITLPLMVLHGCYNMKSSSGGGEDVDFSGKRTLKPQDIALPEGYTIKAVAINLTFPTGVAFNDSGTPYVTESGYSYGEVFKEPRLLKINRDGTTETIASGDKNGPWNGVWNHDGHFYIAEGGQPKGGKILRTTTGAFLPFGTASDTGQVITGQFPCSGAIMRIPVKGGNIELVA